MSTEAELRGQPDGACKTEPIRLMPGSDDLPGKLPTRCGVCRTLWPDTTPGVSHGCLQCIEACEDIDWADIDAIEEAMGWLD